MEMGYDDLAMWVYVFGETKGEYIKLGRTASTLEKRRKTIDREFSKPIPHDHVLLAAVRGYDAERDLKKYFVKFLLDPKGSEETYKPVDELIEYVAWLRRQHFTTTEISCELEDIQEVHPSYWLPDNDRRIPLPRRSSTSLFNSQTEYNGPLANTYWDFMPNPLFSFQDYFTPPEIVKQAWVAMGSIDLDAASHFLAQKRFRENGIRIPDFFSTDRSGLENEWHGNVWLNPPYGNNEPWFRQALEMLPKINQLCWLSPVYVFTTKIARECIEAASASVLLSPTPEFYNPGDSKKKGTNLPHMIVYWGNNKRSFLEAFSDYGIPMHLELGLTIRERTA